MNSYQLDLRHNNVNPDDENKNKPSFRLPLSNKQQLLKQYGETSLLTQLQQQFPAPTDRRVEQ